jgi:excisionase family DNA binding protein
MPSAPDLVGSDEAARLIGINRATLTRWVQAGKITPLMKLPGITGAVLFHRRDVEKLAAEPNAGKAS